MAGPSPTTRIVLLATGVAAVLLLFSFCDPLSWTIFPRCPLHQYTGWNCPGCGTSRALRELAHGHFKLALHYNSVTIFALPFFLYLAVRPETSTTKTGWLWLMLGLLIAFGILRNLPFYPFILLAPPA